MRSKSLEASVEERVANLVFETGSIRNLEDHEILPSPSPQYDVPSYFDQAHSRQVHPIAQGPVTSLSSSEQSKSTTDRKDRPRDDIVTYSPSLLTPGYQLAQGTNDGDDELDLLRKSPLSHIEPNRCEVSKANSSRAFSTEIDDDGHIVPPNLETKMKSEATLSLSMPKRSSQPDLRPSFVPSTNYPGFSYPHTEETLPHRTSQVALGDSRSLVHTSPTSTPQPIFHSAIPSPTKKPTVIFSTNPSAVLEADYAFPDPPPTHPTPQAPKEPPQRQHQFHQDFTLPSLKSINPDYKKSKSLKRKREKERETGRNEWTPMGLNKWAATVSANPVWKKVARASKCLTTREWAKWMRVDFREERKWKIALAYNISKDVLNWHAAGTAEARIAKGISVRWKRPLPLKETNHEMTVDEDVNLEETDMEVAEESLPPERTSLLGVDYGSDDEEEDEDNEEDVVEPQNVADGLEPGTLIANALEDADTKSQSQSNDAQVVQPKTEEVEDLSALIGRDSNDDPGTKQMDMAVDDVKPGNISGLKTTSNNPVLTSQPTPSSNGGDTDTVSTTSLRAGKSNVYAPFREIIAYSEDDKLFLDLEEFDVARLDALKNVKEAPMPPPGLESIFPDLHILDFDFTPVVQAIDGKRRPEKKIDRDDPNKRLDDILYTRLYPTGDFMTSKPTLIGPLRPSKNWKSGGWLSLDDSAVTPESDVPSKIDDSSSVLFDARSSNGPSLIALQLQTAFLKDKDIRKRSEHLWTDVDDGLLKSLCERYPNNWALISECFNASRLTISTDKRTPRDCLDRWREKWGPETRRLPDSSSVIEATPPPTQMTTRGVKRLASVSVSGASPGGMLAGSEPRKKRRHALVMDTIRKANKKRAEALQKAQLAQRKTPGVHETHAQYSKLPRRTPAELSRAKADKEALQLQEMQQARKRQEEVNRNMMRIANGQGSQQPTPQQTPQTQPQQQSTPTMSRPAGTGIPAQVVPQIRNQVNISQQQRANTPGMQQGRLTQQQLLQVRAAQQQQHALAHAQNQIQANGVVAVNGAVPVNNAHLSPPYVTRDVALSVSPPHNSAATSAVNSPRPPSAQAQVHPMPIQVPGNTRGGGTYYLPNIPNVQGYTTEQLQTALRISREVSTPSMIPTMIPTETELQHQQQPGQQGFPGQS
ncbi:hypothetical protein H0H87_012231 [Tephrocybe sp. NHM501043]|nr:hypothetical protein H0H87_012231 [Tephrocybe sp. NHM501043]